MEKGYKIIPGHGALSSFAELESYRQMLFEMKMTTKRAIANGHLEEFIASQSTAK